MKKLIYSVLLGILGFFLLNKLNGIYNFDSKGIIIPTFISTLLIINYIILMEYLSELTRKKKLFIIFSCIFFSFIGFFLYITNLNLDDKFLSTLGIGLFITMLYELTGRLLFKKQ